MIREIKLLQAAIDTSIMKIDVVVWHYVLGTVYKYNGGEKEGHHKDNSD